MEVERDAAQVGGRPAPELEETTPLIGIQACQVLWARCYRSGLGVGERESVVGQGNVIVQSVDVGGVSGRQEYRGRIVEGGAESG